MKKVKSIAMCLIVAITMGLSIYNVIKHFDSFLTFNAFNALTLIVTVVFAFLFVQQKQDDRRLRDSVVKILESMQSIDTDKFITNKFSEESITILHQNMRVFNNKLSALESVSKKLNIDSEIKYINERFQEYKSLIDNHNYDYSYLNKSKIDLDNKITLIDSKITSAIIKIYNEQWIYTYNKSLLFSRLLFIIFRILK